MKTDFVANMSYELRTPLTSIGGFAEMLAAAMPAKLAPRAAIMSRAILESVDRLSKLINDVLDLTTGDARGVALERERVDLGGLCQGGGRHGQGARRRESAEARGRDHADRRVRVRRRAAAARSRSSMCSRTPSPTPTARAGSR